MNPRPAHLHTKPPPKHTPRLLLTPGLSRRHISVVSALQSWISKLRTTSSIFERLKNSFKAKNCSPDLTQLVTEPPSLINGLTFQFKLTRYRITGLLHFDALLAEHLLSNIFGLHRDNNPSPSAQALELALLTAFVAQISTFISDILNIKATVELLDNGSAHHTEGAGDILNHTISPILFDLPKTSAVAMLILPVTALEQLQNPPLPSTPRAVPLHVKINTSVELMSFSLSTSSLKQLKPDALIVGPALGTMVQEVSLTTGGIPLARGSFVLKDLLSQNSVRFRLSQTLIDLTSPLAGDTNMKDCAPDETTSQNDSNAPQSCLEELPVEVVVEAGRFTLSLAELAALKPGDFLSSEVKTSQPVTLTAGGQRIARGELIDIEGHLGIRVVSLEEPHNNGL